MYIDLGTYISFKICAILLLRQEILIVGQNKRIKGYLVLLKTIIFTPVNRAQFQIYLNSSCKLITIANVNTISKQEAKKIHTLSACMFCYHNNYSNNEPRSLVRL